MLRSKNYKIIQPPKTHFYFKQSNTKSKSFTLSLKYTFPYTLIISTHHTFLIHEKHNNTKNEEKNKQYSRSMLLFISIFIVQNIKNEINKDKKYNKKKIGSMRSPTKKKIYKTDS